MSTERRLRRLAFQWGGLALAIQLWIYFGFVYQLRRYLDFVSKEFKLETLPDRVSQLRTPALKAPWSFVYFALFLALVAGAIGTLWVRGLREAIAPEESSETDAA